MLGFRCCGAGISISTLKNETCHDRNPAKMQIPQDELQKSTDLLVIGGGPGGYAAAFEAADQGMDVVLVDSGAALGGTCLHRGCIPSKTLLHVARLIQETREAESWGIRFAKPEIDLARLRSFSAEVIDSLATGVQGLAKARSVRVIQATARFEDSLTVSLERPNGEVGRISFAHAIIATGSTPAMPSVWQVDDEGVMDSTSALALKSIPERLLVIGGGYIGLELGTVYASLGARVSVVEMASGLLPGVDRDLIGPLKRRLDGLFENISMNTTVGTLQAGEKGITAQLAQGDDEREECFDRVLVAVGRRPNTSNLGLESTDVRLDERGFIEVDAVGRTSVPEIFAVGDVAGEPMLAHKATRDGKDVIAAINGQSLGEADAVVPAVVFTDPEIAWCGLTESAARAAKRKVKSVRYPWAASGRAQTIGRTDGLTKIIFDPETKQVLGVGIVGSGAGELIAEGTLAVQQKLTVTELAETIHAHPTLSETVMEAVELAAFGSATHLYRAGK
jgi:dihydrolipoamide dehydrogenase